MLAFHVPPRTTGPRPPARAAWRVIALGAGVSLLSALLPCREAAGQPAQFAARVLERLQRRFAATEAFSCRFDQSKRVRQVAGEIHLGGDLLFQKPHFVRMHTTGDEEIDVYANGRTAWVVDRRKGDSQEFDLAVASAPPQLTRVLPPFVLYDFEVLGKKFGATAKIEQGRTVVTLTPLAGGRLPYQLVVLEIDSLDRPVRASIEYVNGDRIDTTFRAWQRLPRVSPYAFEFKRR